jgi:molecular chaperone DnaK (HSP70)
VPTLISYNNDGTVRAWGFKAEAAQEGPAPLGWFKLLLENLSEHNYYQRYLQSEHVKNFKDNPTGKDAEAVTVDYLRCLWDHTMKDIAKDRSSNFRDLYNLRVILAIPAVWSPAAHRKMRNIAAKAGLECDSPVELVLEPEAAALAVAPEYTPHLQARILLTFGGLF